MTDERNNNNNNNNTKNNNKTSNNFNKHTSAEATKIVLKNGLNGAATATATTLLTAPATAINLPPPPPALSTHANFALYAAPPTATAAATTFGFCINNGISSTTLRTSTAATEEATKHQRVSPSSSTTTAAPTTATTSNAMAAATATPPTKELLSASERLSHGAPTVNSSGGGGGLKVENGGIIDYTLNANSSDIDRHPVSAANELPRGQSFGGRLQFFKDGKFILELARSKDGEKGGWVSVPRKLFRAPSSATSSTITPTSTTSTSYPKNESSTSLSFSDDNSSIQSSPWQRDHCWKQAVPRYGISKEMALFYQRPNQLTLSAIGLQASRKKRRRPFDNTSTPSWENTFMSLDEQLHENLTSNGMLKVKTSTHVHDVCVDDKPEGNISGCGNNSEDDACSSSSTGTLTGTDCIDGSMVTQTPTPNSTPADLITVSEKDNSTKNEVDAETENAAQSADKDVAAVKTDERMNTSEDDNDKDVSMAVATSAAEDETAKEQMNGEVKVDKVEVPVTLSPPVSAVEVNAASEEKRASGGGEKRLKKFKSRAKLITIIQKLIDRIPTAGLLYLSKTLQPMISGNGGGATFNQGNSLANKISPPSSSTSSPASAATSRLVELQYHQQHVSPRKRILREFEKVSLEDTGTAGGKRSRAKGNTPISAVKTSPQRVQSTSCAVLTSTSTATMATATNGGFNKSASKSTTSAPPTSSTPTRLYSSYSIHSLLGGGNSSSLNAPATPSSASTSKRLNEHAVVSNINYQQHQPQNMQHNFPDPSYLRAMLASPKSPENNCGTGGNCGVGGGKSPPNTIKKRSPPYSSPLYEHHSRSPTVAVQQPISDYGSRSPGAAPPESNYKIRFAADHAAAALPSSQLQHHQGFYSPYMMSPKYVPTPPTSMSPNSMSSANTARSPRNSSVFSTHIPSSNTSSAPNSIPTRELSPPRSATAPPRESTPRTVPKKTASIRRQFASPTSIASPSERVDDQQQERKASLTTASTAGSAHQQNSFQTVSPNPHHLGGSTLPVSPLHYYMYAPNNAGSSSPNAVGSSSASGTSVAAQAAALAAAYIPSVVPPSYYHPYISTLAALRHNPMWMHHYPGATPPVMPPHSSASPQASSRLSPPFINFSYNGVGAATVAAAAAAAAAFGGPIPPSHFSQVGLAHQMSAPSAIHHAAGTFVGRSTHSPRLMTDENCIRTKTATKQTTASTIYPSSIKDEHSSDVPLNLSKH